MGRKLIFFLSFCDEIFRRRLNNVRTTVPTQQIAMTQMFRNFTIFKIILEAAFIVF